MESPEIVNLTHDEFGLEQFIISKGTYNLIKITSDLTEFTIYFETKGSLKRVLEFEEALTNPDPHFEATALLNNFSSEIQTGMVIEQMESWDYEREENLSNVYYFEHANLENLQIEIIEVFKNKIKVIIRGRTLINGSKGNSPDTSIETSIITLNKDSKLERSVM